MSFNITLRQSIKSYLKNNNITFFGRTYALLYLIEDAVEGEEKEEAELEVRQGLLAQPQLVSRPGGGEAEEEADRVFNRDDDVERYH